MPNAARYSATWPIFSSLVRPDRILPPITRSCGDNLLETDSLAGLLVLQDALTLAHRKQIIEFTLRERIPSMFVGKEWAQEGGLISYGDLLPERYRLAASIVDKILKGAKPAEIPVTQPMKFELVINLKTTKVLDITVPLIMQMTADEVIE
jgi:putative tryptophan/tyrosine transport system substrate-binding protein